MQLVVAVVTGVIRDLFRLWREEEEEGEGEAVGVWQEEEALRRRQSLATRLC